MLAKESISYRTLSVVGFPLSLTIFIGIIFGLNTMETDLSLFLYLILLRVIAIVFCTFFEKLIPYRTGHKFEKGEFKTDATFYLFNNFLVIPAISFFHVTIVRMVLESFGYEDGLGLSTLPLYQEAIIAFFLMEFFGYWAHRLVHVNNFLWRGHATHHSPSSIYWLNNFRNNFMSYLVAFALVYTPMYILGVSKEFLILRFSIFMLLAPYQHINADFRLGFLNYIFSAAPNHRFHHSQNPAEANSNFGLMTNFFDIIHGTFIHGDHFKKDSKMGLFSEIEGYKKHDFVYQELAPWSKKLRQKKSQKLVPIETQRVF
ncbi:MAG: sterol desaturase family protein [Oleispira sp.]